MNNVAKTLDSAITITTKTFSVDLMSPCLIYNYVDDKRETLSVEVLMMSFSSSMYQLKIATNDMSLQIDQYVPLMFTNNDRLLISNENITMEIHIATEFNNMIEKVKSHQDYMECGKLMGNPMKKISLLSVILLRWSMGVNYFKILMKISSTLCVSYNISLFLLIPC